MACLVAFSMASCGGSSSEQRRIAQLEDSIAKLNSNQVVENDNYSSSQSSAPAYTPSSTATESVPTNFVGTYKVTDKNGTTFYFILNEDETANVKTDGTDEVLYCSWTDLSSIKKGIRISFSDRKPILHFDAGVKSYQGSVYIKDGWLYAGSDEVESKHPQWRLKVQKQ